MSLRPLLPRFSTLRLRPRSQFLAKRPYSSSSSTDAPPPPPEKEGPNQDVLPHVSEEAAGIASVTGEVGPELEQGTPVGEVLKRDPEAQENAPEVLKDLLSDHAVGHKFPLPTLPLPSTSHLNHRYSPLLDQVTNLLMRDGKKSVAQTVVKSLLLSLRTKPSPKYNARAPLIPSTPPLETLPSNPILYLQTAIDSVAPLMRIKAVKGSGGFRESIPQPLGLRQRRRKAVMWIMQAADGRRGSKGLAERLADEVVAVVEGTSKTWEKRLQVHRTAVAGRANVKVQGRR